ncbi:MAG: superoxide dismutase [Turneriella sp.]|nr:superoxide dismutase [Turneriella sp.]
MNNTIQLPDLQYEKSELEPVISAKTLEFHYGKHHAGYVTKLAKLIEGTDLEGESLEDIIRKTASDKTNVATFNNAAQIWNHSFYWRSLSPKGGGKPSGAIADLIDKSFGSYEKFREAFASAAARQFGSGWAWLVKEATGLRILTTTNAETPLVMPGVTALLTIDVWEHAYYLDYQNLRRTYIDGVIDRLLNWEFAARNLENAR